MLGIAEYFWRLLPANPILLRVVQMNGKRRRDLLIRCAYLGLLIGVVIISLMSGNASTGNLSELAKSSSSLFQVLSYCQLGLVALLAPIFTAGAITAEKDSQTYDILLATPLSNGQIVLGSLMSRLFFVIALLISGIPIFSITQIFGGVAIVAIVQSFLIAAATAIVTGAVAMAIAVLKVGTRRTIFSFYLFIVVYLAGTFMLDQVPYFKIAVFDPVSKAMVPSRTSWMTGLNPFLALRTIFHDSAYMPPALGDLPTAPHDLQRWPIGWFLSNPANFYTTFMFFISFVLISPSILLLRRLAQSTTSMKTLVLQKLHITRGDKTRKPRAVWSNPIAWREAKTKASAARASVLRYSFITFGIGGALVMLSMVIMHEKPAFPTFITAGSYNPALNQLTVYSEDGKPQTLPLDPNLTLSYIDSQAVSRADPNAGPPTPPTYTMDAIMARVGNGRLPVNATPFTVDENGQKVAKSWTAIDARVTPSRLSISDARKGLLGATIVEFAVILLIVTNAAASTVTREKEDGTLDLLLSTPITSRYYIWGKLRGLVAFVLPLVAVPVASAAFFIIYDAVRRFSNWNDPNFEWVVFPEAIILLPAMLVIVVAFASILGMNMSLRLRKTVMAVMSSVGIVVGICAAMGWCSFSMLNSHNAAPLGLGAAAFSPFTLITVLIDPYTYTSDLWTDDNAPGSRLWVFVLSWIAIGTYSAIVWAMYKSMVKNFDMTIRKQSR
ncbi:MAG TPA: ABC transporter permease subunit [Tepidisphaeraceae bacterium]|jgi:ABC-type transport system involved in multi-copper enzyme maturation permease subunit|nr:ABC transporter permease subunit [Tepidisphaeraceae bacterium]